MKSPPHRRSTRPVLLVLVLLSIGPSPAVAAVPPPVLTCAPDPDDAVVALASVSDDLDVTLADGRILRLAGLEPPRATAVAPDLPARARAMLIAWGADGPVTLHPLSQTPDRWGRLPAMLFRAEAEPAVAALLAAGLGLARPEPGAHACFPTFLAAEAEGRAGRRGLWADPGHAILTPTDAEGLAARAGGMALIEGVLHVHEGRGGLYLALGRDRWGFSAIVSRRDAKAFARAGVDLHDYDGTPVRLRGDLDARFGPRIRLTDPDALESLEPGSIVEPVPVPGAPRQAAGIAAPKHWTVPRPAR